MKKSYSASIVSVPVEKLRYKFNEEEELVISLKEKLSSIFQQVTRDTDFTVMSNGEFGVPLWSLEIALSVRGLGQSIRVEIVVPCDEQDEGWVRVRCAELEGYVLGRYLDIQEPAMEEAEEEAGEETGDEAEGY